jgi:hypothetical protein
VKISIIIIFPGNTNNQPTNIHRSESESKNQQTTKKNYFTKKSLYFNDVMKFYDVITFSRVGKLHLIHEYHAFIIIITTMEMSQKDEDREWENFIIIFLKIPCSSTLALRLYACDKSKEKKRRCKQKNI